MHSPPSQAAPRCSESWTQVSLEGCGLNLPAQAALPFFRPMGDYRRAGETEAMHRTRTGLATAGILSLFLSACGGGGASNVAPIANAGPAQVVNVGANVVLNGAASSDTDGTVVSYAWTQTAGTAVTLSNASSAQPGFVAPQSTAVGTYTFRLVVTDNLGMASGASSVTITVNGNAVPVANAGTAQTVAAGAGVALNGGGSADPDGTIASYAWTQTAGGAVTLSNASAAVPTFAAPVPASVTALTFQLVVRDNRGVASPAASVTITVNPNVLPVANAGPAQAVGSGVTVSLNGGGSSDADGTIASYAWAQTAGPAVTLSNAAAANPTFVSPPVASVASLTFSLVVTDNVGGTSAASVVTHTVNPNSMVSGVVRFARVPFFNGYPYGLNYAAQTMQPARGVIVRALDAGQNVLASTATSSTGAYSLELPFNSTVTLQVVAQMQRGAPDSAPHWDVRVQNGTAVTLPYSYTTAAFSSSVAMQNIDIPSGIAANGTATAPRASGPFAILDTIHTAMQLVLSVEPAAVFPAMYVDWGAQTEGTFYQRSLQRIALLSDLSEDTDEFDQHVVAHEFGHYIERNFSRSDSIGGSHGLNDKLDMRVAFGEGFGYAFAAIVLNDPFARDSFVLNGSTQVASGFIVEQNPANRCWCSEESVWSILWDLHDNVPDGADNISLPFQALWDVLINQQRLTPSVTSLFSFIAALKQTQPAFAPLIDTLVSAQNTAAGSIDAFASTETYLPFPEMTLPLIPVITKGGGPVVVRSIGSADRRFNNAGNRALLRFTPATSGNVTVTVATSNGAPDRDPDFYVLRDGVIHWAGINNSTEYPETETFNVTAGQTYIIDAYDCANGCTPTTSGGTPGNYDVTVTIN